MPYPFNQQQTGVQYATPSQSFPTGGITYPGTGGGGGFNTGGGTTYPGVGANGGFNTGGGVTYPGTNAGGGFNTGGGITYPRSGGFGNYNSGLNSPNLNVTAGSRGVNNVTGQPIPDLNYADPRTLQRLNISDLIYSPNAGGYLFQGRNYSGLGSGFGGDPTANRQASQFYNYIGNLPTRPVGTPALNQFYQNFGGGPTPGPSYNSILSNLFSNASPFQQNMMSQAGFGRTYQGPYAFGSNNNFGTNRFGLGY